MPESACFRRFLLGTSSVWMGVAAAFFAPLPAAAFDPSAGASAEPSTLPDTAVLYSSPNQPFYTPQAPPAAGEPAASDPYQPGSTSMAPLYPARVAAGDPNVHAAAVPPGGVDPSVHAAAVPERVAPPLPVAEVPMGAAPVVQPPAVVTSSSPLVIQPVQPTMPELPPVDAATQAQAQAMLAAQQPPAAPAPIPTGFIAPAPVLAPVAPAGQAVVVPPNTPTVVATPAIVAPVAPPPPVAVETAPPASTLSDQTREILSTIPSHIDTTVPKTGQVAVDRVSPEIKQILGKEKEETYDSVGISIKVRRPGLDTNYELNNAYNALMSNDTETAIRIYKNILSTEPTNQDALFGLAATYHRLGEIEKARPLYGALLKLNPNHREGLNNFLVLVSDESPQDALPELKRLEERNPDFSPIPAQIAVVMDKLGYADQADAEMMRAIELAPDNLTYKYNLAVMLDRQGRAADAAALYRTLIEASLRGGDVPAPVETMQKRLNFLAATHVPLPS